jgi:predicted Zn-dependent protease with MMP-like domain
MGGSVPHVPGSDIVEAIYDALDRGAAAEAWDLARRALVSAPDDPVLRFLCGQALLELDRPAEAASELKRASDLETTDGEFRTYYAWALFRACRFEAATKEIERAVVSAPGIPELHHVRGLCLERAGDFADADLEFRRAAKLDASSFPPPLRFSSEEFERQLDVARGALDERFRQHMDAVTILIEELPPDALLLEEAPPLDPEHLLGLFSGVPLNLQDSFAPGGELPPRIYLFKRNLERFTASGAELAEQIRVTLYHELGHYLGMSEEELDESGYA